MSEENKVDDIEPRKFTCSINYHGDTEELTECEVCDLIESQSEMLQNILYCIQGLLNDREINARWLRRCLYNLSFYIEDALEGDFRFNERFLDVLKSAEQMKPIFEKFKWLAETEGVAQHLLEKY